MQWRKLRLRLLSGSVFVLKLRDAEVGVLASFIERCIMRRKVRGRRSLLLCRRPDLFLDSCLHGQRRCCRVVRKFTQSFPVGTCCSNWRHWRCRMRSEVLLVRNVLGRSLRGWCARRLEFDCWSGGGRCESLFGSNVLRRALRTGCSRCHEAHSRCPLYDFRCVAPDGRDCLRRVDRCNASRFLDLILLSMWSRRGECLLGGHVLWRGLGSWSARRQECDRRSSVLRSKDLLFRYMRWRALSCRCARSFERNGRRSSLGGEDLLLCHVRW